MILISSHQDKVMNNIDLTFRDGTMTGLLDNWVGMLVTYLSLFDDPNMMILEKEGKIRIFHSLDEEWGNPRGLPEIDKSDTVIVVDVASGPQYEGLDFMLENISGIETEDIEENLCWEGFKFKCKNYTGETDDEDEAWAWHEKGHKVMSFIIPIQGESWHKPNCTINTYQLARAKQALKRLVCYLL